jgi:outer membrane protein
VNLLILLMISLTTQADISTLSKEYLNSSHEIKKAETEVKLKKLAFELEDYKRPMAFSFMTNMKDSNLEQSPFTKAPAQQESKTHILALTKNTIWGGELTLSGTMVDFENAQYTLKSYDQSLSYKQDLGRNFFGRNDFLSLDAAKEDVEVAQVAYESEKSKNLLAFISSYLAMKRDITLLGLQNLALDRAQKRLNLVKRQVKDGLKERVDLYSSQTSLNQQKELLNDRRSSLYASIMALEAKLERKVNAKEVRAYDLKKVNMPELPTKKIDQNLNLQMLERKIQYLSLMEKSADNSIFPSISLEGEYETNNYDQTQTPISDGTFGSDNNSKSVSLTISMPIGFEIEKRNLRMARVNKMHAEYEKKLLVKQLDTNIAKLKSTLEYLDNNIKSVINRYRLAKKTVDEYFSLYNKGRANLDQVIRAEEALIQTEQSFVQYINQRDIQYYTLLDLYGDLEAIVSK